MNKIIRTSAIVYLTIMSFMAMAQSNVDAGAKVSSGIIKYSVTVDASALGEAASQVESMMAGASMQTTFKGMNSLTVMDMGMSKTTTVCKVKEDPITLMDVMGNKIKFSTTRTDKEKDKVKASITELDDTKVIANMTCKKATINMPADEKGAGGEMVVYYCPDIVTSNNLNNGLFADLKGYPLEFTLNNGGLVITVTATSIQSSENISDDVFNIKTSGYKEMTQQEMQQMFSKMR